MMENVSKLNQFVRQFETTQIEGLKPYADEAKKYLLENEFPTSRTERFKYTRLSKLSGLEFNTHLPILSLDYSRYQICADAIPVFIVNGHVYLPQKPLPEGLTIDFIASSAGIPRSSIKDVFAAMNVLYADAGVSIHVAKQSTIDAPIELIFLTTDTHAGFCRNDIVIEENAQVKMIMNFVSKETKEAFSHVHTSVRIGKNAQMQLEKVQMESSALYSFSDEEIWQDEASFFQVNTLTLDGQFVRNDLQINVQGEHSETQLNGMYMLKGRQQIANYTTVDHQVANCQSSELYKGIVDEQAMAVFNGKVFVQKDAQKTNAFQSNANVLIGEDASVNAKPELEIYADDVKCSHGSTTGQLDDEALFYLRSRGISQEGATQLLLTAFMSDVLENVINPSVKGKIHEVINRRFNWELSL